MCGISAIISIENKIDIIKYLINSIKQLQNRGYDSAGIGYIYNNNLNIIKYASLNNIDSIQRIENKIKEINIKDNLYIGISHTRWATHGGRTDNNSHPHISNDNKFMLVHNGIIENYLDLKNLLIKNGYIFNSQTDTEIIVNLISYNYNKLEEDECRVYKSIENTINMMSGTWGLVIISIYKPNSIYIVRHGSPILVSINETCVYISSEPSGFCNIVNNYIVLDHNDLCEITINNENKFNIKLNREYEHKNLLDNQDMILPEEYKYWTIKEINEQVESTLRAISLGGRIIDNGKIKLGGIIDHIDKLKEINNIILLGCGTSYNAGIIGSYYLKELNYFNTVNVYDGAEFDEIDIPKIGNTCLIFLSQSGETKDLYRCIEIGRKNDLFMLGIINVVDSLIAREVDCGIYLNAGREIGVASTKAFTNQILVLSLLSLWFSQIHNLNENIRMKYIKNLRNISYNIKDIIINFEKKKDKLLKILKNKKHLFILGKGKCEGIAKEGALKIKEMSYIHAEGCSSSSLKHGPFALLDNKSAVIILAPSDKYFTKNYNTYEEVKSRIKDILVIIDNQDNSKYFKNYFIISSNKYYSDILNIIPLQLISYYLTISLKINPDKPRNLAKVVTVD